MPNTNRMQWPFPDKDADPWFDSFESMTQAIDASGYASREDRNIFLTEGGTVSFTASTGALTWSSPIVFCSTISGYKLSLAAGTATLVDGACLFVNMTRAPTGSQSLGQLVASSAPNTDSAFAVCVRNGAAVYFRNGARVADGESHSLFSSGGGGSSAPMIETVKFSTRESHNSPTPLIVGGDAFNPTTYTKTGYTKALVFRAVAANGDIGHSHTVKLHNLTDNDVVATLTFTSTDPTKGEVVLVEGSGSGQIDASEKMYEVRIALGASSTGPADTIELFGAEIIVTSTPI